MRSLSYRPRKEDAKKDEVQEQAPEVQATEVPTEPSSEFDESVVIN